LNLEASFERQLMKPSFRKVVLSSSSSSKSIRKKVRAEEASSRQES
jgi:hypothetical protein